MTASTAELVLTAFADACESTGFGATVDEIYAALIAAGHDLPETVIAESLANPAEGLLPVERALSVDDKPLSRGGRLVWLPAELVIDWTAPLTEAAAS